MPPPPSLHPGMEEGSIRDFHGLQAALLAGSQVDSPPTSLGWKWEVVGWDDGRFDSAPTRCPSRSARPTLGFPGLTSSSRPDIHRTI